MKEKDWRKILDDDALFDEYLREALIEDLEQEMDAAEKEQKDDPPYEFSEEFEERMAKAMGITVRELRQPAKRRRRRRTFKAWVADNTVKVATILVSFMVGGVVFSAFNPEVRASFSQFIVQMFGNHNEVRTPTTNIRLSIGAKYWMMYLPSGFKNTSAQDSDYSYNYVFDSDSTGQSFILLYKDGTFDNIEFDYDGDYTTDKPQYVNQNEGRLFESSHGKNALLWSIGTDHFLLMGTISSKEMIEIAENIILQDNK